MTNPQNCEELTKLLLNIVNSYKESSYPDYKAINDVIGSLEGAKLEFYRTYISSIQDKKEKNNVR
jgi:hypothetical protein